jgi:hypothetical protein
VSRKAAASAVALLIGLTQASAFDTGKLGQRGSMWLEDLMPLIGGTSKLPGPPTRIFIANSVTTEVTVTKF